MTIPVVLLAFANDQGDHLENLEVERKAIAAALQSFDDRFFIRVAAEPSAGIDDLFALFDRFPDQVAIFHYGGHADGTALKLEAAGGGNEMAHAGGLAQMLGLSKALKLVFLNGCATHDQVKALLAAGVKAVIATAVPINDTMATEFAQQFYETLASGKSIKQSFDAARARIASRYGDSREIGEFRSISFGDTAAPLDAALTWGLYTQPNDDETLDWVLPSQAENQVNIGGAAQTRSQAVAVNEAITQTLLDAITPQSNSVRLQIELWKETGEADLRNIRQAIMDSYPTPVGNEVRKLFLSEMLDLVRLQQLVATYQSITRLIAFAMLSQLWNARFANPALAIDDAQWSLIDAYLKLDAASEPGFDYLGLTIAIAAVFAANNVTPYMKECDALAAALSGSEAAAAREFITGTRSVLLAGPPPAADIERLCVEAETHLGEIMKHLSFIVRYKLATIKGIAISKARHKPAQYSHRQVLLDRVSKDVLDADAIRADFTDNESVILLKDVKDVRDYLNLTPFVIDQNALTGNAGTKLYFHRFTDAVGAVSHYYLAANPADVLEISDAMPPKAQPVYLPIRDLVREFREGMAR